MADGQGPRHRAPKGTPARLRAISRARSQAGLVVALWAVLTLCATAAGTCALLVTEGGDRALSAAVAAADGTAESGSADITTVVLSSATDDTGSAVAVPATSVLPLTREALLAVASPYEASASIWASTPMLFLPGEAVRRGYLLDADSVEANASLVAGAWPAAAPSAQGTIEVAIPATTATALGVDVGTRLRLSEKRQHGDVVPAGFDLVVVGIFDPSGSSVWARDPLRGQGYVPNYDWLPAYGPFVVSQGTLEERDAGVHIVSGVLDPDLRGDATGVPNLVRRLDGLADSIHSQAGPDIGPVLVRAPLGEAFRTMRAELSITTSIVVAVFLLVLALGMTTAALVARVLARRRTVELALLRSRGASTAQLTRGAVGEALVLAILAVVAGAPLAVATYRAIATGEQWAQSWFGVAAPLPGLGMAVALAAGVGAFLPATLLVITALPERGRRGRHGVAGSFARSGVDVMLAMVAAVTYLQLRAHVITSGTVDPFLVVAPAACAIALALLVSRAIPLVARAADAFATRGTGVVVPVAGWHVSRGGAAQGTFLVVLAAAVSTLGVTFLGTWSVSQGEQADAMVGADMVVAQPGGPGMAVALTTATGGTVTPVSDRPVVLGTRPSGVSLVAIDSRLADATLRGALPSGADWASVMDGLAPEGEGAPLTVDSGSFRVTVTGGALADKTKNPREVPGGVTAVPTIVMVDDSGFVTTMAGSEIALDGAPHTFEVPVPGQRALPQGAWHVVAIDLLIAEHTAEDLVSWGNSQAIMGVSVAFDGATSTGGAWDAAVDDAPAEIKSRTVTSQGGVVNAEFAYQVLGLSWEDSHLTLLSFAPSEALPVVMTASLAKELGLSEGDRMAITWDTTTVDVEVARTVAYVPGHVREAAILADSTALARALQSQGHVESTTDAWWVSSPAVGAADAVAAQGWGPVTTAQGTAEDLRDGPLRVPLRVGWALAIAAALVLAVAGSAAHAAAEAQQRAATIARLRALGMARRATLAAHVLQHAVVTLIAVVLGAGVGALLSAVLIPLLVVAPSGEHAVPAVTLLWSPVVTVAVVGAIAVGGLLAGIPSAIAVVRRSTVAALRAGEAS